MRVFVTGATGFVGSAVVQDLIAAGHRVVGLVRSEAGAKSVEAAGAEVHRGDVEDLESLRRGAALADGVIHTAFIHDFSKFKENCEIDRRAIAALGDALEGSGRPLVVTSATGLLPPGRVATEADEPLSGPHASPRVASEEAAAAVAKRGVRVSLVRLAPSVHGEGDHGFVPLLIGLARQKGVSAYIGDGTNRWPGVYRHDAARLYRLALEADGPDAKDQCVKYHATAEEGVPFRQIAELIGRRLGLPVAGLSPEEAADHFGWFKHFASLDCPSSSARTRTALAWDPQGPGLLADIDQPGYFAA